jgi:hypothetical protein
MEKTPFKKRIEELKKLPFSETRDISCKKCGLGIHQDSFPCAKDGIPTKEEHDFSPPITFDEKFDALVMRFNLAKEQKEKIKSFFLEEIEKKLPPIIAYDDERERWFDPERIAGHNAAIKEIKQIIHSLKEGK